MTPVTDYIKLTRPFNCFFAGLAVLIGSSLQRRGSLRASMVDIGLAVISAMLIAAAGYTINDYFDLSIDRINKPNRVLPSGKIQPEKAVVFSFFLFVAGISVSFITGIIELIILAIVNSALLYLYAKRLKNSVILGNIIVAWTAGSTFVYGALANDNLSVIIPIFVYTALYTLSREMIKDAEDILGDMQYEVKTLAVVVGNKATLILSVIPVIILAFLLVWRYTQEIMSSSMFWPLIMLFTLPLILFYAVVLIKTETKVIRIVSGLTKLHMLILLIAYIVLL